MSRSATATPTATTWRATPTLRSELEAHLQIAHARNGRAAITGLSVDEIEAFAALVGSHKRTFFRIGYGFSRQRNGASNMHAVTCIPAVTGAWAHEGGGALHASGAVYKLDKTLIMGLDVRDTSVRRLDQSRIGAILTGEREALKGGGPVKAMLIQNTNPMVVAPNQEKVRRGFMREDLFVVRARAVHDRHGALRRHRAAGDDVPRARRPLYRERPPEPAVRAEGDRTARRLPLQP